GQPYSSGERKEQSKDHQPPPTEQRQPAGPVQLGREEQRGQKRKRKRQVMGVGNARREKPFGTKPFLPAKPKRSELGLLTHELLSQIDAAEMLRDPIGGHPGGDHHHQRYQPPGLPWSLHKMIG